MRIKKADFCYCPDFIYKSGRCAKCGKWIDDPKEYSKSKRNKFEFRHIVEGECECANSSYDLDRICQVCFRKEKATEQKVFFKGLESDAVDHSHLIGTDSKKLFAKTSLFKIMAISLTLILLIVVYLNDRGTFEIFSQNSTKSKDSVSVGKDVREILIRLNRESKTEWIEDPAVDSTGSNSLAVYLESGGENCAIWVFRTEKAARVALDNRILDFSSLEIYVGEDSITELGIVALSPFPGAACEFVIAKVFDWGK